MQILFATANRDKVRELTDLLQPFGFQVKTLLDYPAAAQIEETGETLEQNALLKAHAGYAITGLPTIADDTGLEVFALDGAPGVYSSRYAGDQANYAENVVKLLTAMEPVPDDNRQARFNTVAVFVDDSREIVAYGEVTGQITRYNRGNGGFGYDPIFWVPEMTKTYAEMDLNEKNAISHRGRAFRNLLLNLKSQHPLFNHLELPID